ncbi:hypothetical protein J1N35_036908, partial [Gossypium stocksii]
KNLKERQSKELKEELMRDWPNLYARQTRKEEDTLEFWKYEWRQHGMCSEFADKPSVYFRLTLNLLKNFDNLKQDLGFKRGSKVGDILKNLRDKKYKVPQIVCNRESQLLEIRFCYKEKKAIDCPNWVGSRTCNTQTANIFLPGGAGGTDAKILKKSTLKKDLIRNWPNLYARQVRQEEDNLEFWKYEWRQHGMCSDYPNKPSEYFNFTLKLLQEFNNLKEDKKAFDCPNWVGSITCNTRTANIFLPDNAEGTDAVNYNFSHELGVGSLAIPELPTCFYPMVLEGRML